MFALFPTDMINSLPSSPVTRATVDDILVSILIYNYETPSLEHCLQTVFAQDVLRNFEVIFCDDASRDSAWEIANDYAARHAGKITLSRNNRPLGQKSNRWKGIQMCRGGYRVELTDAAEFLPAYVRRCIEDMARDDCLEHSYIARIEPRNPFMPADPIGGCETRQQASTRPLVSVCVYNYNYGRYLAECLESVFAQTWSNVEISFSDNASTDDSWKIARRLAEAHPEKMSLTRNRCNFGTAFNHRQCRLNVRGKYLLRLCSDDALHPEFVERCVTALELHPDAAFAMVHRDIIDERGVVTREAPFYDRSCLIPGPEQAAVYMMSSINPSISQVLYNTRKIENKRMAGNLNHRWFGERIADFHMCCQAPVIYLRDALLHHRIHGASHSMDIEKNLLQCMGEYVLQQQLADIADSYAANSKASRRLDAAQNKLSGLCLRYCVRALSQAELRRAKRYFHLAQAIAPEIEDDETFKALVAYWQATAPQREELLRTMQATPNLVRRAVSYEPPPGHVPLDRLFPPLRPCAASCVTA
jgi:glycosyltransferase involved in cell wall biosynthesis